MFWICFFYMIWMVKTAICYKKYCSCYREIGGIIFK
jgi:hypothetical protein